MNPIVFAMRRPLTIMVAVVAVVWAWPGVTHMPIAVIPNQNHPVIYVAQPYGGMDPAQREGLLPNYYEYHFLYIGGIHYVESRNTQGMALMPKRCWPRARPAWRRRDPTSPSPKSRHRGRPGLETPPASRPLLGVHQDRGPLRRGVDPAKRGYRPPDRSLVARANLYWSWPEPTS